MKADRLWVLALMILGVSMAASSFVSASRSGDFGPWLMPIGIGIFLVIVCGFSLFVPAGRVAPSASSPEALLVVAAALLAYPFVLPYGGFLLTTCALAIVLGVAGTARPRWLIAAGGVGIVGAVWAAFTMLLGVRFPSGVLF